MSKAKIAVGAAFGAIAGFVTGVLFAPKSGKESREDIKKAKLAAKDTVVDGAEKVVQVAEKKAQQAKAWGEEVVEEVAEKATELKGRAEQAVEGAKKGFNSKPKTTKK
jgi:gas vesicle protein